MSSSSVEFPQDGWVVFFNLDNSVRGWLQHFWSEKGQSVALRIMLSEAISRFKHFPAEILPAGPESEEIRKSLHQAGKYKEYRLQGGRVYQN